MRSHGLSIQLLISSLSGGGAERVLALLARGLAAAGHRVSVVTLFGEDQDFYRLPPEVDRAALDLGGESTSLAARLTANFRRVRALRREMERTRPDVVVSFMSQMNVLAVLAARRRWPVVITEHVDPRMMPLARPWAAGRRYAYPRAAKLVSVSRGLDACFDWLPPQRRAVIYNPIDRADLDQPGDAIPRPTRRTIIGMGRLHPQKGFDLLIEAFARVAGDFPDWGLAILGEGAERTALESQVKRLQLGHRVLLPGALANPFPTLKQSDIFVLPSRFEGFGNSLVEALACGLPAIATDCRSGPAEIVTDGSNGLLVSPEDVPALAAALARLMTDESLRRQFAMAGTRSVERFELDRIMVSWEQLLVAVAGR
ncbi:MAG: glycosyltransferase family 4 protein [Pirellulales bacterium]